MTQENDIPSAELIYTADLSPAEKRRVQRLAQDGKLKKLYSGIYTSRLDSPPDAIVKRNWAAITSHILPGGIVSYLSAARGGPVQNVLHITRGQRRHNIQLPGLAIQIYPGQGAQPGDTPYKGLYLASEPRWLLENLVQGKGLSSRVLPQADVEAYLEKVLTIRGADKLYDLRDRCLPLAGKLNFQKPYDRLNKLISALLGTHEARVLHSRQALARATGKPYDPDRLVLFDILFNYLNSAVLPDVNDPAPTGHAKETFAFFEAYFSNYIEGTTFLIDEAERIVFEGAIIPNRNEDSHDIIGTFQAAINPSTRDKPPATQDAFLVWLQQVNAEIMKARPDKQPGQWKQAPNQAGSTVFVHPDLVRGTLSEGFDRIAALSHPLAIAMMAMFVVAETHPFADGNGRTARLIMNCFLSRHGLSRIMIPTVYREDYILPLKALSNNNDPVPLSAAMVRAQRWSAAFDYTKPRKRVRDEMAACNAFQEDLRQYKLLFPESKNT
jgi:hypothetical protein